MSDSNKPTAFCAHALVAFALSAAGCGINCDRNPDEPPIDYKKGVTEDGLYDSAKLGLQGPFLEFPPGRTYRFYHDLGGVPREVEGYLSFANRCGAGDLKVERSTLGSGNQVTLETPTDPTYFDVRNDTCSDVCLRVTASHPILTSGEDDGEDAGRSGDGG